MKVEIAFGSRRASCAPLPYRFRRLKPGERWTGVILSPMPVVIVYHWLPTDKPAIHTMPTCICQTTGLPSRERAYVGASQDFLAGPGQVRTRCEVLEMPDSLRAAIELLAADRKYVRGLKIELQRQPTKQNGRIDILRHRWLDTSEVKPDLDVMTFVQQLWQNFVVGPVESTPIPPAGPGGVDDGGEIPFGDPPGGEVLPYVPVAKGGVA